MVVKVADAETVLDPPLELVTVPDAEKETVAA